MAHMDGTMDALSDNLVELVLAAQNGRVEAFAELIGRHQEMAFAQAYSVLRDFHLVQDVTQDAFFAAYENLQSLHDPRAFPGWLRGIVRHCCHRVLRRADMEWVSISSEFDFDGAGVQPDEMIERREMGRLVLLAVDHLPADLREVVHLFYLKHCSQAEVAAFLSLPVSTVNNRLHAARGLLKKGMMNMVADSMKNPTVVNNVSGNIGSVLKIDGPLVTVKFESGPEPDIFDALAMPDKNGQVVEKLKVAQRLGDRVVRCLATGPVEGLTPGANVMNARAVGIGLTPWMSVKPLADEEIGRAVQMIAGSTTKTPRLLETGIKPIDLFCPFAQGGSAALLGIQGVGRIVLVEELARRLSNHPAGAGLTIFYFVHRNEPDSVRDMLTKEKGYPGDLAGAVQTVWILNDNATDPEFGRENRIVDATMYCSPILGIQGLYPSIDPLVSTSRMLQPGIVGQEHCELIVRLREVLGRAKELMADPVLLELIACRAAGRAKQRASEWPEIRMRQLPGEDRVLVSRARKIERFLTTPFFVAEPFGNRAGAFVSREDTVRGCQAILKGDFDDVPESAFQFIGKAEESRERSKRAAG